MLPDFEMIQHQFLGGQDITIIPVFDVHWGDPACMEQEFMAFIKKVSETPNVYLVIGGDILNVALKSSVSNVYRERYMVSEAKRMMAKILEPVKDRILCFVQGNHEARSSRESDDCPLYDIASKLDLETLYRENAAFVKIQLGIRERENGSLTDSVKRPTYMMLVTHGSGGGILTGGAVNKFENFAMTVDGLDLLVAGHVHKPWNTQPGKIYIDTKNNKISIKPFEIVSASSWLGYSGYPLRGMMRPSAHCIQRIILRGEKKEICIFKSPHLD